MNTSSGNTDTGLALIFPGQGSQSVGMLSELFARYPQVDETFSEDEGIFSFSWAKGIDRFSFGINLKTVRQSIGGASGSGTGLAVGAHCRPHRALGLGFAVQNVAAPKIELIEDIAREQGIKRRVINDEEIVDRLVLSLVNEGAAIIREKMAARPSDIDIVYLYGYGFPAHRGGPMFYADTIGLKNVRDAMLKYRERYGDLYWTPAPLLDELANAGKTFEQWAAERA